RRLDEAWNQYLFQQRNLLQAIKDRELWSKPATLLAERQQALQYSKGLLTQITSCYIHEKKSQLAEFKRTLDALDPRSVLKRGFVAVLDYDNGHLISQAASVFCGQHLRLKFADGEIVAQVSSVCKGDESNG
ncbi:MAG: hypothetical protein GX489_06310, partial [Firmicutes bacterium]|nr:hypothetical protein [Bacillota bacterium]